MIAAFQWRATNQQILDDLQELPADQWCAVSYENLLADTEGELRRLCEFAGVPFDSRMQTIASG
ncbi:MAG: sulfotransferase, partial [Bacteroidetes bacterium]|nr:sulfotransferase [Bacteroidota bacterium]